MKKYISSTLIIIIFGFLNSFGKENVPNPNNSNDTNYRIIAAGCLAATAQTELNLSLIHI